MNSALSQPLAQGLMIALVGMALVFAALALLWGITRLLTIVFAEKQEPAAELNMLLEEADAADAQAALDAAAELTAERGRVAAMVAAALLANALPLRSKPSEVGPVFEHGRIAPSWVTANRARTLQTWQPPRVTEPKTDQAE